MCHSPRLGQERLKHCTALIQVFETISHALPTAEDLLDSKSRVRKSWSLDQSHVRLEMRCLCATASWWHSLLTDFPAAQVIITTWMLQTKVDCKSVESVMALLDSDVRTV